MLALLIGVESTQDTRHSSRWARDSPSLDLGPPAVRGTPQIEDDYQRVFYRGNIGETEEQMLSTVSFRPVNWCGSDPRLKITRHAVLGTRRIGWAGAGYRHLTAQTASFTAILLSSQHIADLRKQIDKRFHSPLHVTHCDQTAAGCALAGVSYRGALAIPVFLVLLIATQADRKVRKWRAHPGELVRKTINSEQSFVRRCTQQADSLKESDRCH